jgi:hypothetical protein
MNSGAELDRLVFREVDQQRWSDFERLFGSRGGPKACWCVGTRRHVMQIRMRAG